MIAKTVLPAVMAAVAAVMDLRCAKVDNGWILFCYGCGLTVRFMTEGARGIPDFFAGAFLPILLLGGLFAFGMLGSGDVKTLSVLGGVMGVRQIWKCMVYSILIGAGISAAILISTDTAGQRFCYFRDYIRAPGPFGERRPYRRKDVDVPENFHFTVPIFLSVLLYAGGVY